MAPGKPTYEPPRLIEIATADERAYGASPSCQPGSSAGGPRCGPGQSNTGGVCQPGQSNTGSTCQPGQGNRAHCQPGGSPRAGLRDAPRRRR